MLAKKGWDTFWALFCQTHLVTLLLLHLVVKSRSQFFPSKCFHFCCNFSTSRTHFFMKKLLRALKSFFWCFSHFFGEEKFLDQGRVARFFSVQTYQNGKNNPNDHTLYQKTINYTKWS
jgi:hypothetical protein